MGKYIKLFDNQESYDSFKNGSNYVEPNISFVKDAGSLINNRLQIVGGESDECGDSRDPQVQLEMAYDNSGDWEYSYHTVKLLEASDGPLGGATLSTDEDGMKVLTFNKYDLPRGYASFKIYPCVNVKVTEYNSDGIVGEMVIDDVFMNGVSIYQGRYFYIEDTVTGYKYKAQLV